jgi:hypothetical protein
MHALSILHRALLMHCPWMHAKRRDSLMAAVRAAMFGSRLTLSELGRGLRGPVSVKHNIKRVDRLLANAKLHAESAPLYALLTRYCLVGVPMPLIVVDWSELSVDGRWQLLRASVALQGRSLTLYEEVHPQSRLASRVVHKHFVARLASMLPAGTRPIIMTDAGFRSPWFQLIEQHGWHFLGRIRNRDMVRSTQSRVWIGCKQLYAKATTVAQDLGRYAYVRTNPIMCNLVLIKRTPQGRHKRSVFGLNVRARQSLKQSRAGKEPWLLAASVSLSHLSAQALVALYAQRMQIEEAFRDLKSDRFGLGLSASRTTQRQRLAVLLLIGALATFVLRLIGEVAQQRQMQFQFQSNTRRSRSVLSVISLARQVVQKGLAVFPPGELNAALSRLRDPHYASQL